MTAFIAIALRQLGLWLLSSTFRHAVKVVKKWVTSVENLDVNSYDGSKYTFALENIKKELKDAGIEIAKGVSEDAKNGVKTISENQINYLIEKFALRFP